MSDSIINFESPQNSNSNDAGMKDSETHNLLEFHLGSDLALLQSQNSLPVQPAEILNIPEQNLARQNSSETIDRSVSSLKFNNSLNQDGNLNLEDDFQMAQSREGPTLKNIVAYYQMAHLYFSQGQTALAKKYFQYVTTLNDKFEVYSVNSTLAQIFQQEKDVGRTLYHLKKALPYSKDRAKLSFDIATMYSRLGIKEKAEKYFKLCINQNTKNPVPYYKLAKFYFKRGDLSESIDFFSKAQVLDPTNQEYISNLGHALILSEDSFHAKQAIKLYTHALQLQPNKFEYLYGIARGYEILKNLDEAINFAKQASQIQSKYSYYYLGILYMHKRNNKLAAEAFVNQIKYDPGHIDSYIELATIAAISGDLKKSKTIFERALKIEPRNYKCNTRYGYLLKLKLKDYIKATQVFQQACLSSPENYKAFFNLGECYALRKDYTKAIECLKEALRLNPKFSKGWRFYGIYLYEMNHPHKALEQFQKALRIDINDLEAKIGLANCYYLMDQYESAIKVYEEIREQEAGEELEQMLGNSFYMLKNLEKAKDHFLCALNENETKCEALYNLGVIFCIEGDFEQAYEYFSQATKSNESFAAAYLNAGNALYMLKRYEESFKQFLRAVELNLDPNWINYISNLFMEQGQYEQAISWLRKSLTLNPNNSDTLYYLGLYFFQTGDYYKAASHAKQALSLNENHSQAKDLLEHYLSR